MHDVLLIGGGLQSSLMALAILDRHPSARLAIVERGATLGGNHTWCFFERALDEGERALAAPLVTWRWPSWTVRFPGLTRSFDEPYAGISSGRLHHVVSTRLRDAEASLFLGRSAIEVGPAHATLDDGTHVAARLVIDARGAADQGAFRGGWQTFVGLELALARPHRIPAPVVMDACVPQEPGFRFFYVLPLDERRVLVEETRFHEDPHVDADARRAQVLEYASLQGLDVLRVEREERGCLAMPSTTPALDLPDVRPLRAGVAGGWFHPATGYSFHAAVRLALAVAASPPGTIDTARLARLRAAHLKQARFGALLNRMLFGAFEPDARLHALARFHALPAETVRRFHALDSTAADRARIVCGRPPRGFSLRRALSLSEAR